MSWTNMVEVGPTWFELKLMWFVCWLVTAVRYALYRRFRIGRPPKNQPSLNEGA